MTPPSDRDDADDRVGMGGRLWRMEERQKEIQSQLTWLRQKADEQAHAAAEWRWRMEQVLTRLDKPQNGGILSNEIVRVIVYGLIAGLLALAGVKVASVGGLLS